MCDENRADAIRNLILEKASENFLAYSYSNTTTEQISNDLGISKKTLYKYFPRKEDLLYAVIERKRLEMDAQVSDVVKNKTLSFVEKSRMLGRIFGSFTASMPQHLYRDMERLKPGWLRSFQSIPDMEAFFAEGVKEGMIRSDINLHLILVFMATSMDAMIGYASSHKDEFTLRQILEIIPRLFSDGFLTEKGRSQIKVCK